jgi:hypothetical protein
MDTKFLSFQQLRSRAIESTNKVAFLVECFNTLHSEALPEDFENLGGRIAGIIKQAGGDYCRVLQLMWIASANGIQGSHLNYIQKMLSRDQQRNRVIDTSDRGKFTRGKYGNMVKS